MDDDGPAPIHISRAHEIDFQAFTAKWVRVDCLIDGGWKENPFSGRWELWEATDDPLLWEVRSAWQDACTATAFGWSAATSIVEVLSASPESAAKAELEGMILERLSEQPSSRAA
ncbi:unnamed protein product [Vitrella brassicaformis CCMP3155]|uniref:Uncharacterized protein n=1 Tax=Vitrella brassicaformis (strain CCMP3155) TaxID=1169540 RepID=A0A0G4H1S1_VITBC|nr:unnamed protein product [Vitrella brassicaformis CCMP3155]|eukprot:CEM37314.1 unnamed protein product [Vitrella brassicaformis CCMP3155]